ncbi:MAG: hypothetical protein ACI9A8_002473, partial [Cryomorphaceae bacterium]
ALSDDKEALYYIVASGTRLQSTRQLYSRSFPLGMRNQRDNHCTVLTSIYHSIY